MGVKQLVTIATVAGALLGTSAVWPQQLDIPKTLYLESVRLALDQASNPGLSGVHFKVADTDRFLRTVGGWLQGVAQDPEYLRATQDEAAVGFTQPKGWTGTAQSLATSKEQKYNGYVIFTDFQPALPITPLHEAIHAFTFAIDGGDIDRDKYGGPEYLSSGFRDLLSGLRKRDAALCEILD